MNQSCGEIRFKNKISLADVAGLLLPKRFLHCSPGGCKCDLFGKKGSLKLELSKGVLT